MIFKCIEEKFHYIEFYHINCFFIVEWKLFKQSLTKNASNSVKINVWYISM